MRGMLGGRRRKGGERREGNGGGIDSRERGRVERKM